MMDRTTSENPSSNSSSSNSSSGLLTTKRALLTNVVVTVCVWVLWRTPQSLEGFQRPSQTRSFDLPHTALSPPSSTSETSSSSSSLQEEEPEPDDQSQKRSLSSLTELTNSSSSRHLRCDPPLVPVHDRIFPASHVYTNASKIPRLIHVSMKSRCLHELTALGLQRWKDQFPSYAFFFHDDDAVQRLLHEPWPEFPNLYKLLNCVMYTNAMLIDIWRILVIYRYGGFYADIEVWPGDLLNETALDPSTEAFFLTDPNHRPSQWFFAAEPRHPIFYFTMIQIQDRLYRMDNVYKPKVVYATGPEALRWGFIIGLELDPEKAAEAGIHAGGKYGKSALKVISSAWVQTNINDVIEWKLENGTAVNGTVREKVTRDTGVEHWQKEIFKDRRSRRARRRHQSLSCVDLLFKIDEELVPPNVPV